MFSPVSIISFKMRNSLSLVLCVLVFILNSASVKAEEIISGSSQLEIIVVDGDSTLTNSVLKEKDPVTALALCVFMGPLGIHRIYLGTSRTTAIAYVLTGAGFGVLWVTDTIFLIRSIVRKDVSMVSDNRHYFIWNK